MAELDIDRLEYLKKKFCELASSTLPIEKFLKYKKSIMLCSSFENLETIVKNLTTEICQA
jgi:hypothetical protein